MYPDGQDYLYRHQIIGFVRAYVPFLGWIAIVLQDPARLREAVGTLFRNIGCSIFI